MHSPRDRKATLELGELEPGLPCYVCPTTGGHWIDGDAYWAWLRAQPSRLPEKPADGAEVRAVDENDDDADAALVSPRSGRLMRKFEVGRGLRFRIDFDATSGGFWLDGGEYQALRARNLHDELNLIASDEWQRALRAQRSREAARARLESTVGPADRRRLDEAIDWLAGHAHRDLLLAELLERLQVG
jgi:Zn-finger nucleic acid-binding protein